MVARSRCAAARFLVSSLAGVARRRLQCTVALRQPRPPMSGPPNMVDWSAQLRPASIWPLTCGVIAVVGRGCELTGRPHEGRVSARRNPVVVAVGPGLGDQAVSDREDVTDHADASAGFIGHGRQLLDHYVLAGELHVDVLGGE